ncbi:MAG TPA: hypothetical protein VIP09_02190 [Dehalococcoidia bacterium]
MTVLLNGIDTDNYDGAVSVARFRSLYDNHAVRFNIIGLEAGMPFAAVQRDNSLAAGLTAPFAYKFPYWEPDDVERMKRAAGFGLPVSIDVEYGNGMPGGWGQTVQRIQECKDVLLAEGRYWGIYSSPSEWERLTGGSMAFAGDNGWSATYPYKNLPPKGFLPDFTQFPAFGGTLSIVWQYADQCYDEPSFDMNAMEVADVPTPVQLPNGWAVEGNQIIARNANGLAVVAIGDFEGQFPGRVAKLFGDTWWWLRKAPQTDPAHNMAAAYWTLEAGD